MNAAKFPLSIMPSAPWNVLDATGRRVATCHFEEGGPNERQVAEGERLARQIVEHANTGYERLNDRCAVPIHFQDMMLAIFFEGKFTEKQTHGFGGNGNEFVPFVPWSESGGDMDVFLLSVRAHKEHLRRERGDNPGSLFLPETKEGVTP